LTIRRDKVVKIWDIEAGKEQLSLDSIHGDAIQAISWNWNGSLFATVCKDKKIRVIDPRANTATQVGDGHQGIKPSRVAWLGQLNKVATTGFSKMRERQFAVWDAGILTLYTFVDVINWSVGYLL
jgi:WD40 repeat protein